MFACGRRADVFRFYKARAKKEMSAEITFMARRSLRCLLPMLPDLLKSHYGLVRELGHIIACMSITNTRSQAIRQPYVSYKDTDGTLLRPDKNKSMDTYVCVDSVRYGPEFVTELVQAHWNAAHTTRHVHVRTNHRRMKLQVMFCPSSEGHIWDTHYNGSGTRVIYDRISESPSMCIPHSWKMQHGICKYRTSDVLYWRDMPLDGSFGIID